MYMYMYVCMYVFIQYIVAQMAVDNFQNSTAVLYICSEFVVTNEKTDSTFYE